MKKKCNFMKVGSFYFIFSSNKHVTLYYDLTTFSKSSYHPGCQNAARELRPNFTSFWTKNTKDFQKSNFESRYWSGMDDRNTSKWFLNKASWLVFILFSGKMSLPLLKIKNIVVRFADTKSS